MILRSVSILLIRWLIVLGAIMPWSGRAAGTWTLVGNQPPGGTSIMLLLPDGTVMCQNSGTATWYRLTPDIHGSYLNGTWTTLAPMHYTRRYYSAQVLRNGKVLVAGAEYGSGGATAEIYDPQANVWTTTPTPPDVDNFIDSISETLPNGNVMIAPVSPATGNSTVIWNTDSNSWSLGPTMLDGQDEASWVKLPDGSILTIDPFGTASERYIPSLNQWIKDADVPVTMYGFGGELGAAFLLPNGNAFFIGGTNHTAIYTPSGTTNAGAWTAGPTIPNNLAAVDAPAAMMANGNILCALGPDTGYSSPTYFYEYNYVANTFTLVSSPGGGTSLGTVPYGCSMLDLPDGTVLFDGAGLYSYQPSGAPLANGIPIIDSVSPNLDGSFLITGTGLTGISEGAAYGDDEQMASDYPVARITDLAGNIRYCRTYNWSTGRVMTGTNVVSTEVMLPAGLLAGTYPLVVTANGIPSTPYSLTITGTPLAPVTGLTFTTIAASQMGIRWNAIGSTETGYVVQRSTDGVNYSTVAMLTTNTLTYTDTAVTPLGQYYYLVLGTNSVGLGNAAPAIFAASPPVTPVGVPWQNQDIGAVLGSGATGTSGSGVTVIGAGSGIGGSGDQFQSEFQPIAGDVTLTARVVASQNTGTNALAGVMLRNSLDPSAAEALMAFGGGSGEAVFQTRASDGTAALVNSSGNLTTPYWVRLVRSGNAITGYTSPDGNTWTQQGSALSVFSPVIYAGLAVSSGTSNLLNTSTFDKVTVTGAASANPIPAAEWKLDEVSGATALDSRGSFDGTYNNVTLGLPGATPVTGYAAGFNGTNASIALPPLNLNSNVVTITGWLNLNGNQNAATGILFNRANTTVSGLNFFNSTVNELGYTWDGSPSTYNWHSALIVPTNQWTFVALVIEPTRARIFMATNGVLYSATNNVANVAQAFDGPSEIGWDTYSSSRYFNGQLDEVQYFNQALTPSQLADMVAQPIITVTAPTSGATYPAFVGMNLSVSLSATNGHNLSSVQYFSGNGQLLGESATPPFAVTTTNLNAGAYAIFARLFYDGGFSVDSPLDGVNVFIEASITNTWDADSLATGADDGDGGWGGGAVNWWNGTANVVWSDYSLAAFGSGTTTNCTVTLNNDVSPYAIRFNTNAGGTYTLTGTNAILLNTPGIPLDITADADATIGVPLTGPNSLVKLGAGTLTLKAANSYAGATLVNAGILKLGTNTALGSSVNVANGGTLDLNGQDLTASMFGLPITISSPVAGDVALTNSSASMRGQLQDVVLGSDATIAGPNTIFIRGTSGENGNLNLNGHTLTISGNVLLDGVNMTGPGNLTLNSGTLQLIDYYGNSQRDTTLAGTGNLTINAGAAVMTYRWGTTLTLSMPLIMNGGRLGSGWPGPNGATFPCPILVNSNSIIDFDGGYGTATMSGNITGAGGLTLMGDGNTRTFTGTNSYGWTTIGAGGLQIGNGGASGTLGLGCVTNNVALSFNRTGVLAVTNRISGPGSLSQNGAGTVVLYGTNIYIGSTMVNAGKLLVAGTLAGGQVTVAAQASLGGSGTIDGPTTIQTGGTLLAGLGGFNFGTLTISNTLNLGGNVLFALNKTNAQTSSKITGLSTITYGGTLTVTNLGPSNFANGDTFTLFQAANYSSNFTNITLPVLPTGLVWNTSSLLANGSISVSSLSYVLTYNAGAHGTISGASPQTVNYGASGAAVTATANSGYTFTNWSDGLTANPRTDLKVTNNLTVTANFTALAPVPPVLNGGFGFNSGGFRLTFSGPSGQTYRVLASTNLLQPMTNWIVLTNGTFSASPVDFTNTAPAGPSADFYRIASP
jgi:autotransporter-associated beta strand protein